MPVATMGPLLMQDAAGATGNGETLNVQGKENAAFQVKGTFVGTVTWEGTIDGLNWSVVRVTPLATGTVATTTTTAGLFQIAVQGLHALRARISAYTSGTITVLGTTL